MGTKKVTVTISTRFNLIQYYEGRNFFPKYLFKKMCFKCIMYIRGMYEKSNNYFSDIDFCRPVFCFLSN